jgi:hypothetical protein
MPVSNSQHFSYKGWQSGRGLQLGTTRLPLLEVFLDREPGAARPTVQRAQRLQALGGLS